MANNQLQTFHYVGLQNGEDPKKDRLFILDANVVSNLSTLRKKGCRPDNTDSIRTVNFLRRKSEDRGSEISGVLATIEYSGFHAGELQISNIRDCVLAIALTSLSREDLDKWLNSHEPYDLGQEVINQEIESTINDAKENLWSLFLPSYILSLLVHVQKNDSKNRITHMKNIIKHFINVNYIPPMVIPVTILLYCGKNKIRQQLERRFFKLDSRDTRKQVLSGAWDIAYLSLLRYQELISPEKNTVFVTNDKILAVLAEATRMIRSTIDDNSINLNALLQNQVPDNSIIGLTRYCDSEALDDFRKIYEELLTDRTCEDVRLPSRADLSSVARSLEDQLGISHLQFNIDPSSDTLTNSDFRYGVYLVKRQILNRQKPSFASFKDFTIYCKIMNLLLRDFTKFYNGNKQDIIQNMNDPTNKYDCITILSSDFMQFPIAFDAKIHDLYCHERSIKIAESLNYIFTNWNLTQGTDMEELINSFENAIPNDMN